MITFKEADGKPCGHTVDNQGYIWLAMLRSGKIIQVDPQRGFYKIYIIVDFIIFVRVDPLELFFHSLTLQSGIYMACNVKEWKNNSSGSTERFLQNLYNCGFYNFCKSGSTRIIFPLLNIASRVDPQRGFYKIYITAQ